MRVPPFEYHAPSTVHEALSLLSKYRGDAEVLGGGTDLLVRMKQRLAIRGHLISLMNLEGIDQLSCSDEDGVSLGAGVKLSNLCNSNRIEAKYRVLMTATSLVGTNQIRNMATLGGNILQDTRCFYYNRSSQWRKAVEPCFKRGGNTCHVVKGGRNCFAVYRGDLAPVLIALGSRVTLFSSGGDEEIPIEQIFTGDGKSPISGRDHYVFTLVRIPALRPHASSWYRKFRFRNGIDFATAGVAMMIQFKDDMIEKIRIGLTGVSSSPVLAKGVEELVVGRSLSPRLVAEIEEKVCDKIHPVNNIEDSPSHRKSMVRIMVGDILREAIKERGLR